jgi:mono/diheme cytochrome c family protein
MFTSTLWSKDNGRPYLVAAATLIFVGLGTALASGHDAPQSQTTAKNSNASQLVASDTETYLRDVRPIFMGKCARCHNDQAKFMYNWLDYKTAFADRKEIRRRVWDSWKGTYYKQTMPAGNGPECHTITDEERRTIKEWVDTGAALGVPSDDRSPKSKGERIENGKRLFAVVCTPCHQATGQGIPNQFPPLAGSDFLNSNKNRAIKVLINGRQGEIVVNGRKFNNSMPSFPLSDEEIASALTFVYNSFGNSGKDVTAEEVKDLRAQPDENVEQQHVVSDPPREPSPFE